MWWFSRHVKINHIENTSKAITIYDDIRRTLRHGCEKVDLPHTFFKFRTIEAWTEPSHPLQSTGGMTRRHRGTLMLENEVIWGIL